MATRRPAARAGAKRFRRILHASDFSPASRRAFDEAVALAKANDADLILVHVVEPVHPVVEDYTAAAHAQGQIIKTQRATAEKRIEALARTAKARGARVTTRVVEGHPSDAIAREGTRMHTDLVVVGTHGRTGLRKLVVGSVAGQVVATASCPVLTVRGR